MSERQYVVTLKKGVDTDQFNQDMVTSFGSETIPARSIDVSDAMPLSRRNTVYVLSDEEAVTLRNDSRVLGVELPFDDDDSLFIEADHIEQESRFDKFIVASYGNSFNYVNWGLRRCIEKDNSLWPNWVGADLASGGAQFGETGIRPSDEKYRYILDGTGVDIVIQDTGVHLTHPEFNDAEGNSRVVQYDWYSTPGVSGSLPTGYYSSARTDNHGTNVASIVAGKTHGWAKNAAIYDLSILSEASWRIGAGTTHTWDGGVTSFQLVRAWHNNKSVDASLGVKRPTILNASWSIYQEYDFNHVVSINYRGASYSGTAIDSQAKRDAFGFVDPFASGSTTGRKFHAWSTATQAEIEDCIDDGIHFITSAGNKSFKIDVPGGDDYDNTVTLGNGHSRSGLSFHYNRGKGPGGKSLGLSKAIVVGNIDRDVDQTVNKEQKNESSDTGPGVDLYAPGTRIAGAYASNAGSNDWVYPDNSSFHAGFYNGTSQATPQVAGVIAQLLQLNPAATPEQAKEWIMENAISSEMYEPSHDYSDLRSLLGGEAKYLYNPLNRDTVLSVSDKTPTYTAQPASSSGSGSGGSGSGGSGSSSSTYNGYDTEYTTLTGGTTTTVTYSGSGVDNLNSTIDGMSDGDALLLGPGEYEIDATQDTVASGTYHNESMRSKNIALVGNTSDAAEVIVHLREGSAPTDGGYDIIFSPYSGATTDVLRHFANARIIRHTSQSTGLAYQIPIVGRHDGPVHGYAKNCIFDFDNSNVSWKYDNSGTTGKNVKFEDCSFVNYRSWLSSHIGTSIPYNTVIVKNCVFDDTTNLTEAQVSTSGTNTESVTFDADYNYSPTTSGHLNNATATPTVSISQPS